MTPEIIIAVITSASTLIAALVSIVVNNNLIGYKVDELKKQVEKHNNILERVVVVERDIKTAFNQVDELRSDIKDLQREVSK